jgi:hypothetical protein
MARAKGIDFFTIDPRLLRKYDNRDAIEMLEIYTQRLPDCYCGLKRTVLSEPTTAILRRPGQIDLLGLPSYDAPASGHGAVW